MKTRSRFWLAAGVSLSLYAGGCVTRPPVMVGRNAPATRGVLTVGGSVKAVDTEARVVTITTAMGVEERILVDERTSVSRSGTGAGLKDLSGGQNVKIDYVRQPDGSVLAKSILIGYYVPHCSCGASCSCPLSRGCRVLRY